MPPLALRDRSASAPPDLETHEESIYRSPMELTPNVAEWLGWLTRVRFLLITLLLAVVVVLQQYTELVVPVRYFVPLIVLWYTLAIFYVILLRWVPLARWHARQWQFTMTSGSAVTVYRMAPHAQPPENGTPTMRATVLPRRPFIRKGANRCQPTETFLPTR